MRNEYFIIAQLFLQGMEQVSATLLNTFDFRQFFFYREKKRKKVFGNLSSIKLSTKLIPSWLLDIAKLKEGKCLNTCRYETA